MIKVLLLRNVSPTNKYGGIQKHCQELYDLFKNHSILNVLPIENIPTRFLPIINKRIFFWKQLYSYVDSARCDVVHIHGFATLDVIQSMIVARLQKKRIVYSPHYHPFRYLQHPLFGKIYFYCCLRFFLRYAYSIVTITNNDTAFFKRYHKHVYKIPHQYTLTLNHNINVEKRKNMILFVGRNEANKGIFHLNKLDKKYEVHLVTGTGKICRDDFIIHTNVTNEELDVLYRQASLVVIPSRYEAFSYVALEAFAHGTPVVMSNTVMIADYLKGIKGFNTFDFGNENAFLKAVEETIGIPVETEKILSIFSANKVKQQYEHVYLNALK